MDNKEDELRKYVIGLLEPHFKVFEDVKGTFTHWGETRHLIMDLGILPKPELVANGFPNFFIGVEVKFYDLESGGDWSARRKMKEALNQCISYKYSKFGSSQMEPAMVMLATNISTKFSKYSPKVTKEFDDATEDLRHFCFGQNIGLLEYGWKGVVLKFGHAIWKEETGYQHPELLNLHVGHRAKNPIKPIEINNRENPVTLLE